MRSPWLALILSISAPWLVSADGLKKSDSQAIPPDLSWKRPFDGMPNVQSSNLDDLEKQIAVLKDRITILENQSVANQTSSPPFPPSHSRYQSLSAQVVDPADLTSILGIQSEIINVAMARPTTKLTLVIKLLWDGGSQSRVLLEKSIEGDILTSARIVIQLSNSDDLPVKNMMAHTTLLHWGIRVSEKIGLGELQPVDQSTQFLAKKEFDLSKVRLINPYPLPKKDQVEIPLASFVASDTGKVDSSKFTSLDDTLRLNPKATFLTAFLTAE